MINEKQSIAIDMLIEGTYNKSDIAKSCGKSRQWLYESVINDEECKAKLDERLHEVQIDGMNRIKSNLGSYISNIMQLANNSSSDKIKLDANEYLINRVMGGITTKVADVTTDEEDQDKVDKVELANEFEKFKLKQIK